MDREEYLDLWEPVLENIYFTLENATEISKEVKSALVRQVVTLMGEIFDAHEWPKEGS